ncbi:MAG: DNA cytosine methyltransferase [Planctomycetales bacterium]|nr:DNA cytosine methyltransferase [Planctomycetales bacterium]
MRTLSLCSNDFIDDDGSVHGVFTFRPEFERDISDRCILSLFDVSGEWSRPYREAGYPVAHIDILNEHCPCDVWDINGMEWLDDNGLCDVWGILAAVPCTDFAASGARWFAAKDADGSTDASVALARHTLAIIEFLRPAWWVIENPVGRLPSLVPDLKEFGPWYFQPCDFGDPYTKKTGLWGEFNRNLKRTPVPPTEGSKIHRMPPSEDRQYLRSITPAGFARAFFEANP